MAGRILVIRGGAIGDFVLTLPALAALRAHFPHARLEVLGYSHIASLAAASGLADAVRSIEAGPMAGFFARNGRLSPELAAYFKQFDIIISYLYDPDHVFQANLARSSKGQFVQGPHRPDEAGSLHASEVFLQPLQRLAIFEADPTPQLRIDGGERPHTGLRQPPPFWLALHPGSGSERKNWPETFWAELISLIQQTDWLVLLVGGEAEGDRLERLARLFGRGRFEMAQHLALPELARRLQICSGFIGHDSGISHLAAALGLPGLVLWGDSTERVWRPPSPRVAVLRDPAGLSGLTVDRVFAALLDLNQALAGSQSA